MGRHRMTAAAQGQKLEPPTNTPTISPAARTNVFQFLQAHSEPIAIGIHQAHLFRFTSVFLALNHGPLVTRRFTKDLEEIHTVSTDGSFGIGLSVQLPWYSLGRIALRVYVSRGLRSYRSITMQCHLSFPSVVPFTAPIMRLAYSGDIAGMDKLFAAGEALPTDVRPDGSSLLHVCRPLKDS